MPVFGTDRLGFFYSIEPVVTAFFYLDFYDFGHDRSELSLTITGTYRYNIYYFGSDRLSIYLLLYKTGVYRLHIFMNILTVLTVYSVYY